MLPTGVGRVSKFRLFCAFNVVHHSRMNHSPAGGQSLPRTVLRSSFETPTDCRRWYLGESEVSLCRLGLESPPASADGIKVAQEHSPAQIKFYMPDSE
jgi:hypothetical protein